MESVHVAEKLWDMANIITGFAIAQVLATTFALAKHELKALKGVPAHWAAFLTTLLFTGFYIGAIVWCGCEGRHLNPTQYDIWTKTMAGRVGAVILFTLVLVLTLVGHRRDELKRQKLAQDQGGL
jgi:hypothetical protein